MDRAGNIAMTIIPLKIPDMATLIGRNREGAQSFPYVAGTSYNIPDNNSSDLHKHKLLCRGG